jgi:hypothetical protein
MEGFVGSVENIDDGNPTRLRLGWELELGPIIVSVCP